MTTLRISAVLGVAAALTVHGCSKDERTETAQPESEMTQGGERASAEVEEGAAQTQQEVAQTGQEAESEIERVAGREQRSDEAVVTRALTDNEIARIAEVVNTGEIEQAQLAITKAQHPQVKEFAAMMIREHGDALREMTGAVQEEQLVPEDSSVATELQNEAARTLAKLRAAQGAEFDRQYMEAQLLQHQKALNVIEDQLMPSAEGDELIDEVEDMRDMVEMHLVRARQIQQTLAAERGVPQPATPGQGEQGGEGEMR